MHCSSPPSCSNDPVVLIISFNIKKNSFAIQGMFLNSPWLPPLLSPSPELWDEVGFHLSKLSTGWSSRSLEQPYWFCQRPTQPWEALTRVPPWRSWHPWPRPNCPWQGRRSPWDQKVPNTSLLLSFKDPLSPVSSLTHRPKQREKCGSVGGRPDRARSWGSFEAWPQTIKPWTSQAGTLELAWAPIFKLVLSLLMPMRAQLEDFA